MRTLIAWTNEYGERGLSGPHEPEHMDIWQRYLTGRCGRTILYLVRIKER